MKRVDEPLDRGLNYITGIMSTSSLILITHYTLPSVMSLTQPATGFAIIARRKLV